MAKNSDEQTTTSGETVVSPRRKRGDDGLGPGPLFTRVLRVGLVGTALIIKTFNRMNGKKDTRNRDRDL